MSSRTRWGIQCSAWADAENYGIVYKVIYDRAGLYWKTFYSGFGGVESDDGKTRFVIVRIQNIVDDRTQHASVIANHVDPEFFGANLSMDDFTLAGFQKYCKEAGRPLSQGV